MGTVLVEGSSGRVRRTNESTERDFLNFEGERVVEGIKGPWTSMGGKTGLPSDGMVVVGVVEEWYGRNSAAITNSLIQYIILAANAVDVV